MHRVHVDEAWEGLVVCGLGHIRLLILVNRHFDFDFPASSLADRLDQTGEPRMGINCFVNAES